MKNHTSWPGSLHIFKNYLQRHWKKWFSKDDWLFTVSLSLSCPTSIFIWWICTLVAFHMNVWLKIVQSQIQSHRYRSVTCRKEHNLYSLAGLDLCSFCLYDVKSYSWLLWYRLDQFTCFCNIVWWQNCTVFDMAYYTMLNTLYFHHFIKYILVSVVQCRSSTCRNNFWSTLYCYSF